MTRFEDLFQRVALLNGQLRAVDRHIGSPVRHLLYTQLWGIVADLNQRLGLALENTCLDLSTDGDRLIIHYWSGSGGSVESETRIWIDRSFHVERNTVPRESGA